MKTRSHPYRIAIQVVNSNFFFFFKEVFTAAPKQLGGQNGVQYRYAENDKAAITKCEGSRNSPGAPCSQIHEIVIIVNTAVLITIKVCFLLNRCNPNHIPAESFFLEISKPVPKFTLQSRGPRMAETFLCEKERS